MLKGEVVRKPFLLRVDDKVLAEVQRWAEDELRSLNGQIEWILRKALVDRKRPVPKEEQVQGQAEARK